MDTKHYQLQLEKLKKRLLAQTRHVEGLERQESLRDSTQELSLIDNHPADIASENYERAKDLSLHEKNRLLLEKVKEALVKIERGSYGYCENCGKPIPPERLAAVPYMSFAWPARERLKAFPMITRGLWRSFCCSLLLPVRIWGIKTIPAMTEKMPGRMWISTISCPMYSNARRPRKAMRQSVP